MGHAHHPGYGQPVKNWKRPAGRARREPATCRKNPRPQSRGFFSYTGGMQSDAEFSRIAEIVRRMKQERVATHGDDPDESLSDLMGFCAGVRAGKQLFLVYHGEGPYAARQCAFWTSMFLSCDEIFQVADARYKTYDMPTDNSQSLLPPSREQVDEEFYRTHPEAAPGMLGEAWERGEREGISECIVIQRYPFVGPPTLAHYGYERTGRKLVWGKIRRENPDEHTGAIQDHIKDAYRKRKEIQPQIDEVVTNLHAEMKRQGLDDSERPYWTDRGMAKFTSARPGVFLVQYMSPYPQLPDAVFKDGDEIDPVTMEPIPYA